MTNSEVIEIIKAAELEYSLTLSSSGHLAMTWAIRTALDRVPSPGDTVQAHTDGFKTGYAARLAELEAAEITIKALTAYIHSHPNI